MAAAAFSVGLTAETPRLCHTGASRILHWRHDLEHRPFPALHVNAVVDGRGSGSTNHEEAHLAPVAVVWSAGPMFPPLVHAALCAPESRVSASWSWLSNRTAALIINTTLHSTQSNSAQSGAGGQSRAANATHPLGNTSPLATLHLQVPFDHLDAVRAASTLRGTVAECSDGIDNNGDGLIDLADPQCRRHGAAASEAWWHREATAASDGLAARDDARQSKHAQLHSDEGRGSQPDPQNGTPRGPAPSRLEWTWNKADDGDFLERLTWNDGTGRGSVAVIQDEPMVGRGGCRWWPHGGNCSHWHQSYTNNSAREVSDLCQSLCSAVAERLGPASCGSSVHRNSP